MRLYLRSDGHVNVIRERAESRNLATEENEVKRMRAIDNPVERPRATPSAHMLLSQAAHLEPTEKLAVERRVVEENLDLAFATASRYRNKGAEMKDIRQVACVGLVNAVKRYDPSSNDNFISFAVPTISGEIKRYFRDASWPIRPPRSVQETSLQITALRAELVQSYGREPTVAEWASATGRSVSDIRDALECRSRAHPGSLDAEVGSGGNSNALYWNEIIAAEDPSFSRVELSLTLNKTLKLLPVAERHIIYLRFFCDYTHAEIARTLGVSQMHISRHISQTLSRLHALLTTELFV